MKAASSSSPLNVRLSVGEVAVLSSLEGSSSTMLTEFSVCCVVGLAVAVAVEEEEVEEEEVEEVEVEVEEEVEVEVGRWSWLGMGSFFFRKNLDKERARAF